MPRFTILSRKDAWVDYVTEVEAPDAQTAVDMIYEGRARGLVWEERGVVEFDACHMVALDDDGQEIESTARGKL
jgi:hypothetical protein